MDILQQTFVERYLIQLIYRRVYTQQLGLVETRRRTRVSGPGDVMRGAPKFLRTLIWRVALKWRIDGA